MSDTQKSLPHRHLMTLNLDVDARHAVRIGQTPYGHRAIAPVIGGAFEGERLSGVVRPGGADWALIDSDRTFLIDVRLILETTDNALIYLSYEGRFSGDANAMGEIASGKTLPPDRYTLAITAKFECGDPRYSWLNTVVAAGTGRQSGFNPVYTIFEIG